MDDMEYDDAGHDIEDEEVPEEEEEVMEEEIYENGEDGVSEDSKVAILDESHKQPNTNRITTKYMTKYERARILGTRALQIRYVIR
jgi:DNA-directed RNA polymerase I, II, and III subunit RPABC2